MSTLQIREVYLAHSFGGQKDKTVCSHLFRPLLRANGGVIIWQMASQNRHMHMLRVSKMAGRGTALFLSPMTKESEH